MPNARATGYLVPVLLLSLEPAPDEVSLPKPELPPLPASPPEPGRAVPLVAAPLVPLGRDESLESDELVPDDDGPLMALPFEGLLGVVAVAAMAGPESKQVRPAMANAQLTFLFMG